MKNIHSKTIVFKYFVPIFFGSFLFFLSCDKVEPPFNINNEVIDTTRCPVPEFPALGTVTQKVLVEDFTGHKCGNCPRAHEALQTLINQYGDKIVGVAYHVSDYYASPDANGLYTYNFMTPEGTEIDNNFLVSANALPKGLINRTKFNNNIIVSYQSWNSAVSNIISQQPKVAIQIINNYNNVSDGKFCSHIKITFLENITDTLMFFCGLTEDSIIKAQKDYDANPIDIPAYNHMHAFRDGLNGSFGVILDPSKTLKDSSIIKSYFYDCQGKDYVFKNLKIVAFVHKFSNNLYKEVLQTEERKIME